MRLSHNSVRMTIWSQKEIQLAITTTRKTFPFFKSVSPVFGLRQLSVKPGWLRHALLVQVRQLILFLYLQMRLILMTSVNQLAWVYHSNHSIPEDREEELSGSKIKNIYINTRDQKPLQAASQLLPGYFPKAIIFNYLVFALPETFSPVLAEIYAYLLHLISPSFSQKNWCMSWKKPRSTHAWSSSCQCCLEICTHRSIKIWIWSEKGSRSLYIQCIFCL